MARPVEIKKPFFGQHVVHYGCPHCDTFLKSPVSDIGKLDSCPDCNRQFNVPGEQEWRAVVYAPKAGSERKAAAVVVGKRDTFISFGTRADDMNDTFSTYRRKFPNAAFIVSKSERDISLGSSEMAKCMIFFCPSNDGISQKQIDTFPARLKTALRPWFKDNEPQVNLLKDETNHITLSLMWNTLRHDDCKNILQKIENTRHASI